MINIDHDLSECNREPIHIPSAIQPHGIFIAIESNDGRIIAVSENITAFFPFSAKEMMAQPLSIFFPHLSQWVHDLPGTSSPLPITLTLENSITVTRFIIFAHYHHSTLIIEAEPTLPSDLYSDDLAQLLIEETIKLTQSSSIVELCNQGTIALQRLSGFDRIMAYRFDQEYNGCVIAEANIPEMESYLNHHFPASDIPVQARELYRTNLIRYIADASYTPVPLYSLLENPIDMSQSSLRSVSPIHLEYLRNMGVNASMSLSIIINGQLWGLFACHHAHPLPLAYTIRRYCEMFIRIFNAMLQEKIKNENSQEFFRLKDRHSTLKKAFVTLSDQSNLHEAFNRLGDSWLDALESDGVCLLQEGKISIFGKTPTTEFIRNLSEKIDPLRQNGLYATESLEKIATSDPISASIAGVISLIITDNPRTEILWFRREWVQILKWAGNPDKAAMIDTTQRISPRKSFESFVFEQRGKSIPWKQSHIMVAMDYKEFGGVIELDAILQKLKQHNELLIQQGKKAMMGEMIDAIAHQWAQPLNALSLLISGMSILLDETDIDHETLNDIKKKGMVRIAFMNETLMTFRNFFKPVSDKKIFSINQSIRNVSDHFLPQLHFNDIHVTLDDNNDAVIEGSENEFKQIILILLSNACEILIENKKEEPWIKCTIERDDHLIKVHICDNAGGILPENINRLFEPYFSTKSGKVSRGIGLYLSKIIMEEHFKGKIIVKNEGEGASFTLFFNA